MTEMIKNNLFADLNKTVTKVVTVFCYARL